MSAVILAYADPQSVTAGETIAFMVSCEGVTSYRCDIVRLLCCATGSGGPGFREEVVATRVNAVYPARRQDIAIGSYGVVPGLGLSPDLAGFTVQATIWPTRPGGRRQNLLGTWSQRSRSGFALGLDEYGAPAVWLGDGSACETVSTGIPLAARRWHFVAASFDAATRRVRLYQETLADRSLGGASRREVVAAIRCGVGPGAGPFLFAAWHEGEAGGRLLTGGHYDGKIDRPRLANRVLEPDEMAALAGAALPAGFETAVIGAWDFSCDISSERITDLSLHRHHGRTVNLPGRAVTGFNWTGQEMNWRHAPEQYGAIHFHCDDLYDAGWEPDFSMTVPMDLRSGVYAAHLRAGEAETYVPFFVRPPQGTATAEVVYLASTATYMAYANCRSRFTSPYTDLTQGRLTVADATDLVLLDRPELGLSTYDTHADGSGVCYSSRLRPVLNCRPRTSDIAVAYDNFAADLLIVDWLEHVCGGYDVITDEDLHSDGAKALEKHRVLVTGTHPEYASCEMLDAIDAFLRRGGRLMYLGGNGFYWRIAYHATTSGVIEVRRGEGGVRAWASEPGEYHHSFTGEYGGMWRRQGRPPNLLTGVGFVAQGFDASSHYRRTSASRDPRAAFIFEGIEEEIVGGFGLLRAGAAGLEIDCCDRRLGTPAHALVLASSEAHSNVYHVVPEEILTMHGCTDATFNPQVRADMVFFECPNGGAVFSVGSIAFAGSLSHCAYGNTIARIAANVLRRFLDATPFAF